MDAISTLSKLPSSMSIGVMETSPVTRSRYMVIFLHLATGSTSSITVTVKLHVALSPLLSVTVQTTVVVPMGNPAPSRVDWLLKSFVKDDIVQFSHTETGSNSVPVVV